MYCVRCGGQLTKGALDLREQVTGWAFDRAAGDRGALDPGGN